MTALKEHHAVDEVRLSADSQVGSAGRSLQFDEDSVWWRSNVWDQNGSTFIVVGDATLEVSISSVAGALYETLSRAQKPREPSVKPFRIKLEERVATLTQQLNAAHQRIDELEKRLGLKTLDVAEGEAELVQLVASMPGAELYKRHGEYIVVVPDLDAEWAFYGLGYGRLGLEVKVISREESDFNLPIPDASRLHA